MCVPCFGSRRVHQFLILVKSSQVDRRVASSGVSQETLSLDHVRQIVSRLVFDSKIEEMALTPYLRSVSPDEGPFYRSTQQALTHYDRFTSLPVRNIIHNQRR